MDIWGQWFYGDGVSDKFRLNFSGRPSQFEGKVNVPDGAGEARLQVVAADQAGNFGQHTLTYRIAP